MCRYCVVFLFYSLLVDNALAAPVNWSVDAFLESSDGTIQEHLTGSFTYDEGIFSNANLALTDLNDAELFRYEFASNRQGYVGYQYIGDFFKSDPTEDLTGVSYISIGFNTSGLLDYTNAIGSFPITNFQTDYNYIVQSSRQTCLNASLNSTTCQLSTSVITVATSGTLSTVPIPAAAWLFGWVYGMVGLARRKNAA